MGFTTYFVYSFLKVKTNEKINKLLIINDLKESNKLVKTNEPTQAGSASSIFNTSAPVKYINSTQPRPNVPANDHKVHAWYATKALKFPTDQFKAFIFDGMSFRMAYPLNYSMVSNKKYPVIIILHGKGEQGDVYDNERHLINGYQAHIKALKEKKFDGFVIYPQNPGTWYGPYYPKINDLMNALASNLDIDLNRIIVHGLSLGGRGAMELTANQPKLIAADLAMSPVGGWENNENLVTIPTWIFQGKRDNVPSYTWTEYELNRTSKKGIYIKYTLYSEIGHNTWDKAYTESDFFPFINRAHKANPVAYFNKTSFIAGDSTIIALTPGFKGYQWRKNGEVIAGASSSKLTVKSDGVYDARILRDSWSVWSLNPITIKVE